MKTFHFYFSTQELSRSSWYTAEFWLKSPDWDEAFEDALELLHLDGAEYANEDWYLDSQSEEEGTEGYGYYEVLRYALNTSSEEIHKCLLC